MKARGLAFRWRVPRPSCQQNNRRLQSDRVQAQRRQRTWLEGAVTLSACLSRSLRFYIGLFVCGVLTFCMLLSWDPTRQGMCVYTTYEQVEKTLIYN